MKHHMRKFAVLGVLAVAAILSTEASAGAQATPLGSGQGRVQAPSGPKTFQFSAVQLPDGTVQGRGRIKDPTTGGWVHFDITSAEMVGGALIMAGPVTKVRNFPGYTLGATVILAVHDNGNGAGSPIPDDSASTVGPPNLTVPMILALIGPPPPQAYVPLISGNVVIH